MDVQTQQSLTASRQEAAHLTTGGHLDLAAGKYRYIVDTVQQHEAIEATHADRYNLSNLLVMQHKYSGAEPILKDTLKYLAKRPVDEDSEHFLEQEDGTIKTLVQSLKGQGREEEANKLMASAAYSGREEQLQARKQCYGLEG